MIEETGGIMRRFDLADRVAVVTGCGNGIGRAISHALADAGAHVVGLDISDEGGERTMTEVRERGRRAVFVNCDTGDTAAVEHGFKKADEEFGRVDILVNDAARGTHTHPVDTDDSEWQAVINVSLTGYFRCARAAARRMIDSGRGGAIVNISSIAGSSALGRGNFAYSVAKGGVNQMTRELAIEWAPNHIRVNAIQPCQVATEGMRGMAARGDGWLGAAHDRVYAGIPLGRMAEPDDIAGVALFLASDAAAMVTGSMVPVDGGNLALNAGGTVAW
ncbi:MAG TPA: SDR family NAD(P)-dependent oxidoreductase [Candidatus Dormibacteraeota bacterium]|jgi:NAD(P)-dependent dehydrogenase (short-subunit alcohol dehydrogenase family)|nr:SDR family NAD(P)-dependent oxidoreductase [Candidatus Dormibacteraeota bacterium]